MAAARLEGWTGSSSHSGRDFQPSSVKTVSESEHDGCNVTTLTDNVGEISSERGKGKAKEMSSESAEASPLPEPPAQSNQTR